MSDIDDWRKTGVLTEMLSERSGRTLALDIENIKMLDFTSGRDPLQQLDPNVSVVAEMDDPAVVEEPNLFQRWCLLL
jgi:hypothetical protein